MDDGEASEGRNDENMMMMTTEVEEGRLKVRVASILNRHSRLVSLKVGFSSRGEVVGK